MRARRLMTGVAVVVGRDQRFVQIDDKQQQADHEWQPPYALAALFGANVESEFTEREHYLENRDQKQNLGRRGLAARWNY